MRSSVRMNLSSRASLAALAGVSMLLAASATPAAATALLSSHVPAAVATASRVALARSTTRLHLSVSLPLRDEAGLDALLSDIYDPASPNYRH